MEKKTLRPYNLFAGVLFLIQALMRASPLPSLGPFYSVTSYYTAFSIIIYHIVCPIIFIIGCIITSILLFKKSKKIHIGFIIILLSFFISFISPLYGFRTYILNYITDFLYLLSYLCLILFSISNYTKYLNNIVNQIKKLWFIPILITLFSLVTFLFQYPSKIFNSYFPRNFSFILIKSNMQIVAFIILAIVQLLMILFTVLWIVFPYKSTKNKIAHNIDIMDSSNVISNNAYYDMIKHVLLLIFTFGIWHFIWIYRVTGYLNVVKNEEPRKPSNKLLLCIFVPFYVIYWTYKSAQRIDTLAREKGLAADSATLCLIMAIFIPIIAPIIMQDKINNIITETKAEVFYKKEEISIGAANELKTYKELLESGVITQEEFDKKKNQLLNL